MGFFRRAIGKYLYNPFHRLEFLMELSSPGNWYQPAIPKQAAVRSTFFKPFPITGADDLMGQLLTSLLVYGRMLIIHSNTRKELASLVRLAATNALERNTKVTMAPWTLRTPTSFYHLWPWPIVTPETLSNPVTYIADLHGHSVPRLWLQRGGRMRDTRVLDPSCAAIAVQTVADALDARGFSRSVLPILLLELDHYFLREGYSSGGETHALVHAFEVAPDIRRYGLGQQSE
ncbi:MAG: hypothetical protein NTZ09_11715 [Candidatus Hydrogenedentes bacterium]|nr:hypothetical protein [Candidatus Hydrogenedentota bacterium]